MNQEFIRQHICPIFVQIAMFQDSRQPDPDEMHPYKCLICQAAFETNASLYLPLSRTHRVKPNNWDFGRDSAHGTPECAHCGTVFANLKNLRRHIVQGRCNAFDPDKASDSPPDEYIHQILLQGNFEVLWADETRCAQLMSCCAICHKQSSMIPQIGRRTPAHGCTPFLQVSMVHQATCPQKLIIPYEMDSKLVQQMVHYLPTSVTQAATEALTSRAFEQFWQNGSLLEALQQGCFSYGEDVNGKPLLTHLHTHHSIGLHVPQRWLFRC